MPNTDSQKTPQVGLEQRQIEIYKQDCEAYRHEDRLMWSRFQTAATIEAGLLIARFSASPLNFLQHDVHPLRGPLLLLCLLAAGAILILLLFSASLKDLTDAKRHLARIRHFENDFPLATHQHFVLSGSWLMLAAILIITLVNVLIIISLHPILGLAA